MALLDVLKKTKLVPEEEKGEVRENILESFKDNCEWDLYTEVNNKFDWIKQLRRDITKTEKEIEKKKEEIRIIELELEKVKKINYVGLSDQQLRDLTQRLQDLVDKDDMMLKELESLQKKINSKKNEKKNIEDILWIQDNVSNKEEDEDIVIACEVEHEVNENKKLEVSKTLISPIESNSIVTYKVSMTPLNLVNIRKSFWFKSSWNKVGRRIWWKKTVGSDDADVIELTPRKCVKKVEEKLSELEDDRKKLEENVREDNWIGEWYKKELLEKIKWEYEKKKEEIEWDDRYIEIKKKLWGFQKSLKEERMKRSQIEKNIQELGKQIDTIRKWDGNSKDKIKELKLVMEQRDLQKEKKDVDNYIRVIEDEIIGIDWGLSLWDKEMMSGKKWISWRAIEVREVDWQQQIMRWWEEICRCKRCLWDNNGVWLYGVEWKPMFWVEESEWVYKLIWWNEDCGSIRLNSCCDFKSISWKPCFLSKEKNWKYVVIWWEEQVWERYSWCKTINDIDWKPCFLAGKGNWKYVVIWWEEQLWEIYEVATDINEIGWRPCFYALKKNGGRVVIWWKEQIWIEYEDIKNFQEIWWKPYFLAKKENGKWIVVWWKEQIWVEYEKIEVFNEIWWRPCLRVWEEENWKSVVFWLEKQLWEEYNEINWHWDISWKPCFKAQKDNGKRVVIWWEEKIWEEYEETKEVYEIEWKPYFMAKKGNGKEVVIRWKEQIWQEYELISIVYEIEWKPYFMAKKENWKYVVIWWGKQVWEEYKGINSYWDVGWKPCFRACKDNGKYVEIWWEKQVWEEYIEMDWCWYIGWKPCFRAYKDSQICVVIWWEEGIGEEYKEVWKVYEIEWKPYFWAKEQNGKYALKRWEKKLWRWGLLDEYTEVSVLKEIWWKPCIKVFFKDKDKEGCSVFWWKEQIWRDFKRIEKFTEVWWKPCFLGKDHRYYNNLYWWAQFIDCSYGEFYNISDENWKLTYILRDSDEHSKYKVREKNWEYIKKMIW